MLCSRCSVLSVQRAAGHARPSGASQAHRKGRHNHRPLQYRALSVVVSTPNPSVLRMCPGKGAELSSLVAFCAPFLVLRQLLERTSVITPAYSDILFSTFLLSTKYKRHLHSRNIETLKGPLRKRRKEQWFIEGHTLGLRKLLVMS